MRAPRPITLVVFDEHLMCLDGLAAALDEDPTVAIVATTTERRDVADIVEQRRPDVCLIDVETPDAGCIAAMVELRRRAPGTGIVMLIDEPPPSFVRTAVGAGVRGFTRKDATLRSLRQTVDRVAAGYSLVGAETISRTAPAPPVPRSASDVHQERLTAREQQVLDRLIAGEDTRHIAVELHISRSTARTHVQHVRRKLGAHTKLQAVTLALGTCSLHPSLDAGPTARRG
jgi:DNA-binding NarL/FixJ family response regulator